MVLCSSNGTLNLHPNFAQIREENPRLARDSKILRVTMDNVYEVFTTPREQTGLQGIHFRFMPDMKQVHIVFAHVRSCVGVGVGVCTCTCLCTYMCVCMCICATTYFYWLTLHIELDSACSLHLICATVLAPMR